MFPRYLNFHFQHVKTQLWLSYQTNEVTKKGLGKVRLRFCETLIITSSDNCSLVQSLILRKMKNRMQTPSWELAVVF